MRWACGGRGRTPHAAHSIFPKPPGTVGLVAKLAPTALNSTIMELTITETPNKFLMLIIMIIVEIIM